MYNFPKQDHLRLWSLVDFTLIKRSKKRKEDHNITINQRSTTLEYTEEPSLDSEITQSNNNSCWNLNEEEYFSDAWH